KPTPTRNLILLDPAHGGSDTGAHLTNSALEKDVTLALTARIKPLLAAAGFTVLSTHDAAAELTPHQRARLANPPRPPPRPPPPSPSPAQIPPPSPTPPTSSTQPKPSPQP